MRARAHVDVGLCVRELGVCDCAGRVPGTERNGRCSLFESARFLEDARFLACSLSDVFVSGVLVF